MTMLSWFFENGASSIDIHLRCPTAKRADYNSNSWMWITHHNQLSFNQSRKLVNWCRYKNYNGSDIFMRPHRYDKQPVIFLDDLSLQKANIVANKYRALIIQTSENNTQVWIALTESLAESERKLVQQYISNLGFTDKGSVSGEHLGRVCGFMSQKRKCPVRFVSRSDSEKYNPPVLSPDTFPRRGACAKITQTGKSMSEVDFSWALSKARQGVSHDVIIDQLTKSSEKRGKPAPQKYATRTVRRVIEILT